MSMKNFKDTIGNRTHDLLACIAVPQPPALLRAPLKVKQSHYRPEQPLMDPGEWGSQISRQSAHEGGKVVSLTHWLPLPPGNCRQVTALYSRSRAAWCMKIRVAHRIKYGRSAWVTNVSTLLVFYSVIVVYKGIKTRSFSCDSTKLLTAILFEYSVLMMTLKIKVCSIVWRWILFHSGK